MAPEGCSRAAEARAQAAAAARQLEVEMGSFSSGEEDASYPPDPEDMDPK